MVLSHQVTVTPYPADLLQLFNVQLSKLITGYPGLRRFLCTHKQLPDPITNLANQWEREGHTCGPEWDFCREFAAFTLQKSQVVDIIEGSKPISLGRIIHEDNTSNLSYVPIEELLLYCRRLPVGA